MQKEPDRQRKRRKNATAEEREAHLKRERERHRKRRKNATAEEREAHLKRERERKRKRRKNAAAEEREAHLKRERERDRKRAPCRKEAVAANCSLLEPWLTALLELLPPLWMKWKERWLQGAEKLKDKKKYPYQEPGPLLRRANELQAMLDGKAREMVDTALAAAREDRLQDLCKNLCSISSAFTCFCNGWGGSPVFGMRTNFDSNSTKTIRIAMRGGRFEYMKPELSLSFRPVCDLALTLKNKLADIEFVDDNWDLPRLA